MLLYRAPLSQLARERLKVIRETNDGFEIARRDLELRGPGELLGTRQTGLAQLRVADLMRTPICCRACKKQRSCSSTHTRILLRHSPPGGSGRASDTDASGKVPRTVHED